MLSMGRADTPNSYKLHPLSLSVVSLWPTTVSLPGNSQHRAYLLHLCGLWSVVFHQNIHKYMLQYTLGLLAPYSLPSVHTDHVLSLVDRGHIDCALRITTAVHHLRTTRALSEREQNGTGKHKWSGTEDVVCREGHMRSPSVMTKRRVSAPLLRDSTC
jgi:hypothetical protein